MSNLTISIDELEGYLEALWETYLYDDYGAHKNLIENFLEYCGLNDHIEVKGRAQTVKTLLTYVVKQKHGNKIFEFVVMAENLFKILDNIIGV